MKTALFFAFALLPASASVSVVQSAPSIAPRAVVVPSGSLHLKGFFWTPAGAGPFPAVLFNHGSGGPDAAHTAGLPITEAAEKLAAVFVKHGYAFLFVFRRGQGLSEKEGQFMQDVLQREEVAKGKEGRQHLQLVLLSTDHLADVMAGLAFLKGLPEVDAHRIALAGHSFGGQLTLLAAERDSTIRAAVTFSAAANSWENSPQIRELMLAAMRKTAVPIMLLHAANDYSTAPGAALDGELARLAKPHVFKIYPPVGRTSDDGHNFVFTAVDLWENDVFKFLDEYVRHE